MKYGESAFDILYLLFAVGCGIAMLGKAKSRAGRRMGAAALILGLGDAFHLVPRVLNYFIAADFTAALGIGKLVTSITMTAFYVLLYYVWLDFFGKPEDRRATVAVWALALVRVALCLFPQNLWLENGSDMLWGVLRNVPFVALGALIVALYYRERGASHRLRHIWLYTVLSFLFYIPVAVAAGIAPMLGMLMLPKTVCYVLMICAFYGAAVRDDARA